MFRKPQERPIPEASFDPWCGDVEAPMLRREIEAGNVRSFAEAYAGADGHRREFLVDSISKGQPHEVIDRWPEDEPDSALAFLMRGAQRTTRAWSIRGSFRAESVTPESWEPFFDGLRKADEDLRRSVELQDDGIAWARMITTGRGLQLSLDEQWARYSRAVAVVPGLGNAADQILQSLCAKWAGSHEQMFEFARSVSQVSPAGSPLHRLVATAHFERLLDFQNDDELDRYALDQRVQNELITAAQRSVFSPDFQSSPDHVVTFNWFAFTLDFVGRRDAAQPLLARIDANPSTAPWNYMARPSEHFQAARQRAGLPPL